MSSAGISSAASARLAVAGEPPQHRIDQAGKARRVTVGLRQPHRKIDRGMVRHVEKQDLRGAEQERGLDPRRLRRQTTFEKRPKEMAQGAEPAQHGSDQRARQRAVALLQRGKLASVRVEQLIERAAAAQHAFDDVGGDAAHGEAGHVVGATGARAVVFARAFASRKFLLAGAAAATPSQMRDANRVRNAATPSPQPPMPQANPPASAR